MAPTGVWALTFTMNKRLNDDDWEKVYCSQVYADSSKNRYSNVLVLMVAILNPVGKDVHEDQRHNQLLIPKFQLTAE